MPSGAPFPPGALCCSSDGHRGSSSGSKDPPLGRAGANSCFAFAPLAKFNIPGFVLRKLDPVTCLGFFFKLKACQCSLGTKALSESGCHLRGFHRCFQGLSWNLFLLLVKAPRPVSYRWIPCATSSHHKARGLICKKISSSAPLAPPESCLRTAIVNAWFRDYKSSLSPVT